LQLSYNKTQRFLERCMKIRLFYILKGEALTKGSDGFVYLGVPADRSGLAIRSYCIGINHGPVFRCYP